MVTAVPTVEESKRVEATMGTMGMLEVEKQMAIVVLVKPVEAVGEVRMAMAGTLVARGEKKTATMTLAGVSGMEDKKEIMTMTPPGKDVEVVLIKVVVTVMTTKGEIEEQKNVSKKEF